MPFGSLRIAKPCMQAEEKPTARCTHIQIAQASPYSKFVKSATLYPLSETEYIFKFVEDLLKNKINIFLVI